MAELRRCAFVETLRSVGAQDARLPTLLAGGPEAGRSLRAWLRGWLPGRARHRLLEAVGNWAARTITTEGEVMSDTYQQHPPPAGESDQRDAGRATAPLGGLEERDRVAIGIFEPR